MITTTHLRAEDSKHTEQANPLVNASYEIAWVSATEIPNSPYLTLHVLPLVLPLGVAVFQLILQVSHHPVSPLEVNTSHLARFAYFLQR